MIHLVVESVTLWHSVGFYSRHRTTTMSYMCTSCQ